MGKRKRYNVGLGVGQSEQSETGESQSETLVEQSETGESQSETDNMPVVEPLNSSAIAIELVQKVENTAHRDKCNYLSLVAVVALIVGIVLGSVLTPKEIKGADEFAAVLSDKYAQQVDLQRLYRIDAPLESKATLQELDKVIQYLLAKQPEIKLVYSRYERLQLDTLEVNPKYVFNLAGSTDWNNEVVVEVKAEKSKPTIYLDNLALVADKPTYTKLIEQYVADTLGGEFTVELIKSTGGFDYTGEETAEQLFKKMAPAIHVLISSNKTIAEVEKSKDAIIKSLNEKYVPNSVYLSYEIKALGKDYKEKKGTQEIYNYVSSAVYNYGVGNVSLISDITAK